MKASLTHYRLSFLLTQRNGLLALTGILMLSNLVLAGSLLLQDREIVVIPSSLSQEFQVRGNTVSPSYIEEWAGYYAQLLLTVSPDQMDLHRDYLLRHVHPSAYSALKQHLLIQAKDYRKQRLSTVFHPTELRVTGLSVRLMGSLSTYVGDRRVSQTQKTYTMRFVYSGGRLLITEFEEEGHDEDA